MKFRTAYGAIRSSLGNLDLLPLRIEEETLTRPPQRLENTDKLSRTLAMAAFHSGASGLVARRTLSGFMILSLMKMCSSGGVGMHRMKAPRGTGTKPRASEMPHSWPWMRVTWKAAPPTDTMRTWPAISENNHQCQNALI